MKSWMAVAAFVCWGQALLAADRPNILFIAVDDLKPVLGCYGNDMAKSPNIDRLASKGTTFMNAHCQQAVCGPSRASLLSGRRPDQIRVWELSTKVRQINPDLVMLPQHFRDNGYKTAALGKIYDPRNLQNGRTTQDEPSWSVPYTPGWKLRYDEDTGAPVGEFHGAHVKSIAAQAESQGLVEYDARTEFMRANDAWPAVEGEDVPDHAYEDGAMTDRAIEMMRELNAGDQPFFLAVGFKKPHLPFVAPKKYWDFYHRDNFEIASFQQLPEGAPSYAGHNSEELRNAYTGIPASGPLPPEQQRELIHGYYACVSYIDAQVGRLLDEVEALGIDDDTVIILWGDHGFHLGDHGMWCKHSNFEQATRSPLIIAAPGGSRVGTTRTPVEFVDVYPTLCALAGLPAPADLAGQNLAPVMSGEAASVKEFAVSQWPRQKFMGYAVRTETHRLVAWIPKKGSQDIARGIEDAASFELYDYEKDPGETANLADDTGYAEVVDDLKGKLSAFLQAQSVE